MYEVWTVILGLVVVSSGSVGTVYLGLALWGQLHSGLTTDKSVKYYRTGLWYSLVLDAAYALFNMSLVYTIGATNGSLTGLFLAVVSLLVNVVLLRNSYQE